MTGKGYRGVEETFDLYEVHLGDLSGYTLIISGLSLTESIPAEIYWRLCHEGELILLPESKDFPIAAIFDDLFAVVDGKLRMVSSRSIGSFDYQTIEKTSIGDLFPWAWTTSPVCSRYDNKIFYLSSREKAYYSIWVLDLDQQTESRFGEDIVIELGGRSADHLIAIMNPDKSTVDKKLILTSDPHVFRAFSEEEWVAACGWLYRQSGAALFLEKGDMQLTVESSRLFRPFNIDEQIVLLAASDQQQNMTYLALDPLNKQYSMQQMAAAGSLSEWQAFIHTILHERQPYAAAETKGIKILD